VKGALVDSRIRLGARLEYELASFPSHLVRRDQDPVTVSLDRWAQVMGLACIDPEDGDETGKGRSRGEAALLGE
jgi:hypothetical protein